MRKSKSNANTHTIRNHLSPGIRARKGIGGALLLAISLYLLFGPPVESGNAFFAGLVLVGAFIAFGLGWVGTSQGLMGWSRQVDFDFDRLEVRHSSASLLGRSKPYTFPLSEIATMTVKEGPVKGEGGLKQEAMIEMQDVTGRVLVRAGMFDTCRGRRGHETAPC